MKKYAPALTIWLVFLGIAGVITAITHNPFFLFNFGYIGTCIAAGLVLYVRKWKYARNFVQFAVGMYLLIGVGLTGNENMQIEGFWYFLFGGVFAGAVIHYLVAKIFGPLLFGRGWCGYACWTVMILDLLPYKTRQLPRKSWTWVRFAVFAASLVFVLVVMGMKLPDPDRVMYVAFIVGNALYYAVGIALAFVCKDNRAFCKYVCPITVFLKPASYFSYMRVTCDESLCVHCGTCRRVCPMDVDMTDNARNRENGTECILCMKCVDECPKKALKV